MIGKLSPKLRLVEASSASHRIPAAASSMLAAVASLLLLAPVEAGAGKAAELDGELLACCAAARRADQASDRFMDRLDDMTLDDPDVLDAFGRMRPAVNAYFEAVDRAAEIPARTPEGLQAKAVLLLLHLRSDAGPFSSDYTVPRRAAGRS